MSSVVKSVVGQYSVKKRALEVVDGAVGLICLIGWRSVH